jgi:predicted XRE-type DNA-binding protein
MTMERQSFDNVWDALEDTPAEAASMTMRSNLLIAVDQHVRSWSITQAEAARRLGLTQPRLNDLLRGKIDKFRLDTLIDLATRAGLSVRIDIAQAAGCRERLGQFMEAKSSVFAATKWLLSGWKPKTRIDP